MPNLRSRLVKQSTNPATVLPYSATGASMIGSEVRSGKRSTRVRDQMEGVAENRTVPRKKTRTKRHISWSTCEPSIHVLPDAPSLFPDYDTGDIWYTRKDYLCFLVDRLETIQALRRAGGDDRLFEKSKYSLRGLEVFQSSESKEECASMRKVHKSTILIEQVRQSLHGMKNPERFGLMVGPQSEMAARKARHLAAMDEHDVYGRVGRRGSLFVARSANSDATTVDANQNEGLGTEARGLPLSLDEQIRQLQEANARRLIEIYAQPGYNPFRFPLRRDSLLGSNVPDILTGDLSLPHNLFRIRRDSLTSVTLKGTV